MPITDSPPSTGPGFDGRTAVVSGSAQGIGQGIARRLAAAGATVALLDVADTTETVGLVEEAGSRAIGIHCDVRSPEALRSAVAEAESHLGTPSLAVAAAGVIRISSFLDLSEDDWDLTLDVNLKGTVFLFQAVARRMVDAGLQGSLLALSSVAARGPRPTSLDYGASKVGAVSVCWSTALALAPHGITVNAICPGVVDTPMTHDLHRRREELSGVPAATSLAQMIERIALGRIATVDDVADVALFLLSEQGSYVTGQSLNVCGGMEFN